MAAKAKKKKTVAKKTSAATLTSKPAASLAAFTKGFPQFQPFTLETNMFKGNNQFDKITQDAAAAGQAQVDALVKSTTIFTKGMEDIFKTCMEIAQEAGEKSQTVAKTIMSCKTINEFTDLQTKLAQASFDEFMTNATKISEKSVKLCTDAMEPINDQVGKAMRKATSQAA